MVLLVGPVGIGEGTVKLLPDIAVITVCAHDALNRIPQSYHASSTIATGRQKDRPPPASSRSN